jgi:hypothetical protein
MRMAGAVVIESDHKAHRLFALTALDGAFGACI